MSDRVESVAFIICSVNAYPSLLAKLMEKSLREFRLSDMFGDDGPTLDMALVLLILVWQLQPFWFRVGGIWGGDTNFMNEWKKALLTEISMKTHMCGGGVGGWLEV